MSELLLVGEFLFDLYIFAMGMAANANITDYRVAFIFIVQAAGLIILFIPSLLKEAGLIKATVKYIDLDMILKLIMWVQTLYLAHNFFLLTTIINIICVSFALVCRVKICNEVKGLNISIPEAIRVMQKIDSAYMKGHYPFVFGNFFTIAFLMACHKSVMETIISGSICVAFFGIGIYRLLRNAYISKNDIARLIVIEILMLALGAMELRVITSIVWVEFVSSIRDALKRNAEIS